MQNAILLGIGSVAFFTAFNLKNQIGNILNLIIGMQQQNELSPSEILNKLKSDEQFVQNNFSTDKNDSNQLIGNLFVNGKIDTQYPITFGQKYIYLLSFVSDLFSNQYNNNKQTINFSQNFQKFKADETNIKMSSFFEIHDRKVSGNVIEVSRNSKINVENVIQIVDIKNFIKDQNFIDKIFILIGKIIDIIVSLSNSDLSYKGIRIGKRRVILGIPIQKIVTIYGQIKYNKQSGEIKMDQASYILNEKQELIELMINKLINRKILYYISLFVGCMATGMLLKKLYFQAKEMLISYRTRQNNSYIKSIITDDLKCQICAENPRTIILKPCKHMLMCNVCFNLLRKNECPICKTIITDHIQVYFS